MDKKLKFKSKGMGKSVFIMKDKEILFKLLRDQKRSLERFSLEGIEQKIKTADYEILELKNEIKERESDKKTLNELKNNIIIELDYINKVLGEENNG